MDSGERVMRSRATGSSGASGPVVPLMLSYSSCGGTSGGEASISNRGTRSRVPAGDHVIVLDDDDEEEREASVSKVSVGMGERVEPSYEDEELPLSSDCNAIVLETDSEEGSEGSVGFETLTESMVVEDSLDEGEGGRDCEPRGAKPALGKAGVQVGNPMMFSSVARRTRSKLGFGELVSYTKFFKDDPEDGSDGEEISGGGHNGDRNYPEPNRAAAKRTKKTMRVAGEEGDVSHGGHGSNGEETTHTTAKKMTKRSRVAGEEGTVSGGGEENYQETNTAGKKKQSRAVGEEGDASGGGDRGENYKQATHAASKETKKRGKAVGEEGEGPGVSFKKKKKKSSEIEILVKVGKDGSHCEGSMGNGGIEHAKSLFKSEVEEKIREFVGTMSNPNCRSQLEIDSSSSSSEEDDGSFKHEQNKMDEDGRRGEVEQRKMHNFTRRKGVKGPKADTLYRMLVDTILTDAKELPEELIPKDDIPTTNSQNDELLPLIFKFGDDDPKPVEKTEYEKHIDELWDDYNFALEVDNMGSYNIDENQAEGINIQEVEADHSTCPGGKHEFVLDEQIGIKCRFCSLVTLEIKYVLPDLVSRGRGRSGKKVAAFDEGLQFMNDFSMIGDKDKGQDSCSHGDDTVWDLLSKDTSESLYPHQREAFEFMWKNLAGGINLEELKTCTNSNAVGGCVVAHAPGTGKTRLSLVFVHSYLTLFPERRPVIVAPKGMLDTWEEEARRLGLNHLIHNLNAIGYSGNEDKMVRELVVNEPQDKRWMRLVKLLSWSRGNNILLISYSLFKMLTSKEKNGPEFTKILLEKPGLFVFDEGHTPRNERSLIWQAIEKVKTEQRIILSGTLFQNNLREFYNSLRLVRPKLVEGISSKMTKACQRKGVPLDKGNEYSKDTWANLDDSSPDDNLEFLEELKTMIKPFMHVYKGNILDTLPGLRECYVYLDLLPYQKSIVEKIEENKNTSFEYDFKISLASVHPSLATICLSEKERFTIDESLLQNLRMDPYAGVKTRFVMEVVRLSEALKEKVLVFSQYIDPLNLLKEQLIRLFHWSEGKEVLQMDGKLQVKHRQCMIDTFNVATSEARVLLASTKACGEGISLVGASRVILLDVVWNPAVARQAISRAYRLGQEKFVYTYHLITPGTGERHKYGTQAKKEHLSKLVFSEENLLDNNSSKAEQDHLSELHEDKILREMTEHEKLKDMFINILYPPTE